VGGERSGKIAGKKEEKKEKESDFVYPQKEQKNGKKRLWKEFSAHLKGPEQVGGSTQ